jgi:hypothetical protein
LQQEATPMRIRQVLICGWAVLALGGVAAHAQPTYPMADKAAAKVVHKYQTSSCAQLAAERKAPASAQKTEMEQRVGQLLRQDAQLRSAFLKKVAVPVADKMVVCGFIP